MKYVFTLCIFFFAAGCVWAQVPSEFRKFGGGIYAGPQLMGKIYNNNRLGKVSGVTAGIDLRYAFSSEPQGFSLHFQPGFNTFRLYESEGENTRFYREVTWKWGAFHLPLLARYTFSSGRVRPFAEIGPHLRFRTALSIKQAGTGCGVIDCTGFEATEDLQAGTSNNVVGLTAGAGVEVDLWKVTIPISMRIQESFGTFEMEGVRYDGPFYKDLKTRTIQVTAGLSF